ncbi:SGNH/GDSL hydrolase family protein [Aeromonas rivipollensis]|uniref:SGNH/GDSL hydrolase family protein n=1 Tax=Aeromonas rivipollensis TaxID=948519 RepID=UPI00373AEE76
MFWPDRGSGVDVEPARKPVASAVRQYFTEGGASVPPTVPGGDWFNQITNELLNVLAAAGIAPSKVDDTQLLLAIRTIIEDADIGGLTDFSKTATDFANAYINVFGRSYERNNIVLIGDSITAGVGAGSPEFAYASLFGQAVANYYKDGYCYPLLRNQAMGSYIWTHNGTASSAGLSGDSVSLDGPGEYVQLLPSEGLGIVAFVEVTAGTATTIQLIINGVVVASAPLSGVVYEAFLTIPQGSSWTSSDDVRVKSPSGTLVLSGISVLRRGNSVVNANNTSPLMITCGKSGSSFEYYRTNKAMTAAMANSFSALGPSIYIVALGTNSIYQDASAQTPEDYVASMAGLESDLLALDSDIKVLFTIPPQSNETIYPVIKPGYTYFDYVDAIKNAFPLHQLIDLNIPSLPYVDGVHPNDAGHIAIARRMSEALGIPFNVEPPRLLRSTNLVGSSPVSINNGYVIRDVHGVKHLSGQVIPNSAPTNLLTVLPNEYRPRQDRYVPVCLLGGGNGFGIIHISATNGEVRMLHSTVSWTSAYLDGVSFI